MTTTALDLLKCLPNKNQNDKFGNDLILSFPGMLIYVGSKTPIAKYFSTFELYIFLF